MFVDLEIVVDKVNMAGKYRKVNMLNISTSQTLHVFNELMLVNYLN